MWRFANRRNGEYRKEKNYEIFSLSKYTYTIELPVLPNGFIINFFLINKPKIEPKM